MALPPDLGPIDEFGSNVWLVEEMYRRYVQGPDSVSKSWRDFFASGASSAGVSDMSTNGAGSDADAVLDA